MSVVTSVPAFALNVVFGSRIAPSKYRAIRQMFANRRILFVHCVATRDQRDQPARPDHVKALREEIIVDAASQLRTAPIGRIEHRVISERNVSDSRIEEIFGKRVSSSALPWIFESGYSLAAMRAVIESSSTPVRLVPGYKPSGIRPKKCPTPIDGSRMWAPGLESEPLHRLPDRLDDLWRCVMGVRRGGTCRCIFLGAEHFAQFVGWTLPVTRQLRFKRAGHRTPARYISRVWPSLPAWPDGLRLRFSSACGLQRDSPELFPSGCLRRFRERRLCGNRG